MSDIPQLRKQNSIEYSTDDFNYENNLHNTAKKSEKNKDMNLYHNNLDNMISDFKNRIIL